MLRSQSFMADRRSSVAAISQTHIRLAVNAESARNTNDSSVLVLLRSDGCAVYD